MRQLTEGCAVLHMVVVVGLISTWLLRFTPLLVIAAVPFFLLSTTYITEILRALLDVMSLS